MMTSKVLVVLTLVLSLGFGADEANNIINTTADDQSATLTSPSVPIVSNNVDSVIFINDPDGSDDGKKTTPDLSTNPTLVTQSGESDTSIFTNPPAPTKLVSDTPLTSAESNIITLQDKSTSSIASSTESILARKNPVSVKKLLPDRHTCGLQTERRRIEGAGISSVDEFPWVALLRYRDAFGYDAGFRCTGTLINDRYVLTAAHCVLGGADFLYMYSVRLGEWVVSTPIDCALDYYHEECNEKVEDVGVKKIISNPQYDPSCEKNDVALVQMDKQVAYTSFIRPICLPVQNLSLPSTGTLLTTSGWGTTRHGYYLDIKSKSQVSVWNNYDCLSRVWGFARMVKDQVCIGKANPYDSCTPDSGGPLMAVDKEDKPQWYLEGIMSAGFGCGRQNFFGVYTRASDHIDWVLQTLADEMS